MKIWLKRSLALVLTAVLLCSVCPLAAIAATISPIEDENFTILWATDPQWYSFKYFDIIEAQNNWVADNYARMDMRYIVHTGDFVDNPHSHEQWAVMDKAYKVWDDAGLHYGVLAGNHDVDKSDHTEYSQYFGAHRYNTKPWYGESYEDNFGHYDLMTIDGVDYIFVYMGYNSSYPDEVYEWLNYVLAKYPTRIASLAFHDYLYANGERSASGEQFFNRVVLKNPNVRMVMCGHNYNSTRKIDDIDDDGDGKADRTVYQMMANYQNTTNGGNGFMRFMEFDYSDSVIIHRTYSPYTSNFGSDYEDGVAFDEYGTRDNFTIPFDFTAPTAKKAGDPEYGTVVVNSKVSFGTTDSANATVFPITYQNTAVNGGAYQGLGIYDRNFSLNAADAYTAPEKLTFVTARYTAQGGYTISKVTSGASISGGDPVAIPHDGVVIALPNGIKDENGNTLDMSSLTVGRKVVIQKASSILPAASSAITLSSSVGEMYNIDGVNRMTGNSEWVIYDKLSGTSTAQTGYDHTWNMLFAFEPDWINYRVTAVNTTLGAQKSLAIPQDGFVLAVNTYHGSEALRSSLKEFFVVGKTLSLSGLTVGQVPISEKQSIMPSSVSGWKLENANVVVSKENGAYVMYNTDGQWPSADYNLSSPITFNPSTTALAYDFTIETNAKANIILHFKNSKPTGAVSGQYLSIQSYFKDVVISSGSGDVKGDDLAHSGKIDLSQVDFPADCYNADGTLTLNGMRIMVSGVADTKRYFRDFSLTSNAVADDAVTQSTPLLAPYVINADDTRTGTYVYDNGKLTVNADSAAGYKVTVALNKAVNVAKLQNWLLNVSATTNFDVQLQVTTAASDYTFGLASDFYPALCDATVDGLIPAGTYQKDVNVYGCYTYNGVAPANGISTVKNVIITLGGKGTVTFNALLLSSATYAGVFADGVYEEGGNTAPKTVFETTYPVSGDVVTVKANDATVANFLATVRSDYSVSVVGASGDDKLATGQTVVVTDGGETLASYTIVLLGEIDGNGTINTADARTVLQYSLRIVNLEGAFLLAADYDQNDIINTADARDILIASLGL